jgi:DNA gyrase subunit A
MNKILPAQQQVLIKDPNAKQFPSLLVITENGYGKHTYLQEFRKTARAGKGVKTLNLTAKTGKPVLVQVLFGNEETLVVTTKKGITIRLDPNQVPQSGRSTQGVIIIRMDSDDKVVSGSVN